MKCIVKHRFNDEDNEPTGHLLPQDEVHERLDLPKGYYIDHIFGSNADSEVLICAFTKQKLNEWTTGTGIIRDSKKKTISIEMFRELFPEITFEGFHTIRFIKKEGEFYVYTGNAEGGEIYYFFEKNLHESSSQFIPVQ